MKLGQGYIFTGVCDSLHGGGAWSRGDLLPGSVPGPGGSASRGVPGPGGLLPGYLVLGRSALGGPGGDPPGQLLLWAVRILLECILVFNERKLSVSLLMLALPNYDTKNNYFDGLLLFLKSQVKTIKITWGDITVNLYLATS